MRCFGLDLFRRKNNACSKQAGGEESRPKARLPWADLMGAEMRAGDLLYRQAEQQALQHQFKKCLATADEALARPCAFDTARLQSVRSYALYRLGKTEKAAEAARNAFFGDISTGFCKTLLSDDPAALAYLRRAYPVVTN